MKRRVLHFLFLCLLTGFINCAQDAATIDPSSLVAPDTSSPPGTSQLTLKEFSPANTATDIPVDTTVTILFSEPLNTATVPGNITVNNGASYSYSYAAGNRVVILSFAPVLNPSITYTVAVSTGVQSAAASNVLDEGNLNSEFTTSADTTTETNPHVLAATRYPTPSAVNVNVNAGYAEVTFSRDINAGTVDAGSFSISPAAASGLPSAVSSRTFRLPLNKLNYSTLYTVTLTTAIQDTSANALVDDGNLTWDFTTEADPNLVGTDPTAISGISAISAGTDSALLTFSTDVPVDISKCFIEYDTVSGAFGTRSAAETDWDSDSITTHTVHRIELPSPALSNNTVYYYRVLVDIDSSGGYSAGDLVSAEYSFVTADTAGGSGNEVASTAGTVQDSPLMLQHSDGSFYLFWRTTENGNDDIYGQYFNTAGAPQWTDPDGSAVAGFGTAQNALQALSIAGSEAIIVYRDGTALYGKRLYNSGSPAFRWGGAAAGQGSDLGGITISAGSDHSLASGYVPSTLVVDSSTADMPSDGTATNLLYDINTNFSGLGLANGDLIIWDNAGTWTQNLIYNTDSWNIFPYVLRSDAALNLASRDYYIADQTATGTGSADSIISGTVFQASDLFLPGVSGGDIINCNGTWAIVTSSVFISGSTYEITTDVAHGLAVSDPYTVYPAISGLLTSESVTSPVWDQDPAANYNPGTTVLAGDMVVNENDNTAPVTSAHVSAINPLLDSNYALRLDSDIMDNGHNYSIVRLTGSAAGDASLIKETGYSTSTGASQLNDTNADFVTGNALPGDVVYNIDTDTLTIVQSRTGANQLVLEANIFTAVDQKYMVYSSFAGVTYISAADTVSMARINPADGTQIDTVAVTSSGTSSNPNTVSGASGSILVFYEQGGTIYGKKLLGDGTLDTTWGAADPGKIILAGSYTIKQVLSDGSGGAYVLAHDGASTVRLLRINGTNGNASWNITQTGEKPSISADRGGGASRVELVFRTNNGDGTFYVRAVGYNGGGGTFMALANVTAAAQSYSTDLPGVIFADSNTAGNDGFYIFWYDGRYFGTGGYGIFAQCYSAAGAAQWTSDLFINTPGTYGLSGTLGLCAAFYNDGGSPFGLIPVWYDFHDDSSNTGLYCEIIDDTGSY